MLALRVGRTACINEQLRKYHTNMFIGQSDKSNSYELFPRHGSGGFFRFSCSSCRWDRNTCSCCQQTTSPLTPQRSGVVGGSIGFPYTYLQYRGSFGKAILYPLVCPNSFFRSVEAHELEGDKGKHTPACTCGSMLSPTLGSHFKVHHAHNCLQFMSTSLFLFLSLSSSLLLLLLLQDKTTVFLGRAGCSVLID